MTRPPEQDSAPDLQQLYRALEHFRRDWTARFGRPPSALLLLGFRLYEYVGCNIDPRDPMNPWHSSDGAALGALTCYGFRVVPVDGPCGPLSPLSPDGWQVAVIGRPVPGVYVPGTISEKEAR